jgi:Rieske Fe-S protein
MHDEEKNLTRRGFLAALRRLLVVPGLATFLGPIMAYFWPATLEEVPAEPVFVGEQGSIPAGESEVVRFGRYPALVIHIPEQGLVAYSAVCTHFACIVNWNPESGRIECPCHAGFYDPLDGSVISGPPPAPLAKLKVVTSQGEIKIEEA